MLTICHTPRGMQGAAEIVSSEFFKGVKAFTYKPIDMINTVSYVTEAIKLNVIRHVISL